ncbi:MAG: sulfurtransferase [bacterium]
MRRQRARYALGILVTALLWGIRPAGAGPAGPSLIVDAADLPALLVQFRPMILAVESKLASHPVGYLRGAVRVDEDQWTADSRTQEQLDTLATWARRIGRLGIDGRRMVVLYDGGDLKFASRIRYLLAHYGVPRAVLVNGGWQALAPLVQRGALQGQPTATLPGAQPFAPAVTQPPIPIATRADVVKAVAQRTALVIDVRSPQEYAGTRLLPPVTRGGHIPDAINLPLPELFVPGRDSLLRGRSGLANAFRSRGIDPAKPIIVYCQDGARSSLAALALIEAGYSSVSLYYLSYADWQSDPMLPVVK